MRPATRPSLLDRLGSLGAQTLALLAVLGQFKWLGARMVARLPAVLARPSLVVRQVHFLGNHSLAIIVVSGLFVGLVLGLQGYYTLRRYGSEEAIGLLVALALVRELGPVVTALLFAGRAGTALAAEIGLMKSGEQLAALEAMAVDPLRRIVAPRFIAGLIVLPILAALFSAVGVLGGWLVAVGLIGVDDGAFWSQIATGVDFWEDLMNGVLKSCVFGWAVTQIALFMGLECKPTPEGVARATTQTVVVGSLVVLGLDFVLTALMFG
ncbi:MAG: lipid asymmetry maintenance ABC transporter permease subunit MlaE [Betaproteobacteria bacterium]|nr:lipid asymmetry maintenance ABC transporter permease subunit MlaE [Betaproteobacteria bacterium]